ncbi:MAG: amidohydrolase, partial [Sphingobacteriia bacterium]
MICFLALAVFASACQSSPTEKVDTLVINAQLYTVDSQFTTAEAMAIKDGIIVATGTTQALQKQYQAETTVDAEGKTIYPGFIDAHAHFMGYANSLSTADLFGTQTWEETVERVKAFAAAHPEMTWIQGRGWDQNNWPGKQFPTNDLLNVAFPNTPVVLTRVDGHASIANNKALALAGIQAGQKITGGDIQTKNGKLTGVLIDNADNAVYAVVPKKSLADTKRWLQTAEQNCFAVGLTTITDCGLNHDDVDLLDQLQQKNELNMRLFVMLSDNPENYQVYLKKGPYKTDKIYVRGFKVYADGALGSRGACLLKHYSDQPGWGGFLLRQPAHYDSVAATLSKTDFQMCTHAIGDSANRTVLNIYNKYLGGKNDKRWRIEHAQIVNQADFDLFGAASVVPSVQPTHGTSDMYWAESRLGAERMKGAYAFKQLLDQNGWMPLGTDFPVEDISTFKTFLAAVVRKDAKGFPEKGFQMENALGREATLRGMT